MRYYFGFVLLVATSCSSFYFPNSHNVPVFSRGGEFQGNAQVQIATPNFVSSLQAQTAYSLSNHIGVLANYSYFRTPSNGRSSLGEFGLGYFANPSPKQNTSFFAGYGISESDDIPPYQSFFGGSFTDTVLTSSNANRLVSRYTKFFIQPAQGFLFSKRINLIISLKASRIAFDNIYSRNLEQLRQSYGPTYHFEPAATLKINFPGVNLGLLVQLGIHLTDDNKFQKADVSRVAFGLQWRLVPKKKE